MTRGGMRGESPQDWRTAVHEFISEDDLNTFDGWLKYQGVDLEARG